MSASRRRELLRPAFLALAVLWIVLGIGPRNAPPRAWPARVNGTRYVIPAENSSAGIPLVEVAGSRWEMGFALGRLLQAEIRETIAAAHAFCAAGALPAGNPCAEASAGLRQALPPLFLAEAEGLAAGAEVRTADILLLNALFEAWFPPADGSLGTAGFAAWGPAVVSGQALLGAGWRPAEGASLVWVVRRPDDGLENATLGLPGWLGGVAGLNEAHVAGWALPARTSDSSPAGPPASLILRGALEQAAASQEALRWSMGQPHSGGAQVVFAGEVSAAGVEWSARMQEPLASDANTIFAAGLFRHPTLAAVQLPVLPSALFSAAEERAERAQAKLRANSGWMGWEKGLDFLRAWAEEETTAGPEKHPVAVVLMEPAEMRVYAGTAGAVQPLAFTVFEPLSAPARR